MAESSDKADGGPREDGRAPAQSAQSPVPEKELYPMSNWKYDMFLWCTTPLLDIFFREIHPRGSWRVPRTGPVLFVAAPHANQVSIGSNGPCSVAEHRVLTKNASTWRTSLSTRLSFSARCARRRSGVSHS